jgi:protein tyrosine kinase modulator
MTDTIAQILDTAWRAWRWRGVALLVTWFVCAAGWITVSLMPDIFKSSAVVYVDTANVLQPLLKGLTIESDTSSELELMQKTLISRPNLEKVMRETDLDLTVKNPTEREMLIAGLEKRIRVSRQQTGGDGFGRGTTDLFKIEFQDANPVLARDVVRAVLNIFVEGNLGQNRQDLESARRFIEDQIKEYEAKLAEAEHRIADFRRQNHDLLALSGRGEYPHQLEIARQTLATKQADLSKARARRDALQRELADVPQFLPSESGAGLGPPTSTERQILDLQAKLDDLLSKYTDQHPDVVVTRRKLKAMQKQQEEEMAAVVAPPAGSAGPAVGPAFGPSNPVYEQLKVLIVQEEASVATLTEEVGKAKSEIKRLESLSEGVPDVEAELVKLNRDYDALRSSYDALIASRETERMSRARDMQGEDVRFRILEQPQVPVVPSGPNHLLYLVAVLIAGLGSGTGIAILLALSSDTFANAGQVKDQLAISVLGTVSISEFAPRGYWAVSQAIVFWSGFLVLTAAFASLTALDLTMGLTHVMPGDLLQKIGVPTDLLRRLPIP